MGCCHHRFPVYSIAFTVAFCVFGQAAMAQSSTDSNGMLLAQNAQIEQSRLYQRTTSPEAPNVTADGMPLPGSNGEVSDDSFGAQQILKTEQRVREFVLTGDASMFYTNNVALTRRDTVSDGFFVGGAGLAWNHAINPQLQLQIGGRMSLFRYVDTSSLDFENLGAGVGLAWTPPNAWGISIIGRYDFTELLDKHSNQLLQDHEFTLAVQKVFAFNRVHSFMIGGAASAGISDPFSAQRDHVGALAAYHIWLTRRFDAQLAYQVGGFFYNEGSRNDFNQAVTLGVRYRFNSWMEASALLSFASNRSSNSVFDYDVLNTGGTVGFIMHF